MHISSKLKTAQGKHIARIATAIILTAVVVVLMMQCISYFIFNSLPLATVAEDSSIGVAAAAIADQDGSRMQSQLKTTASKTLNTPKLILVGIFTTADRLQRRALIRETYARLKPANIDLVFIFGRPKTPQYSTMLELEAAVHNDTIMVDCDENMDDGKTYAYFSYVGRTYAPGTFMAGMGYGLSFDLVRWIATDPYPAAHRIGQEDSLLSNWLTTGKKVVNWIANTDDAFYDEPESGQGWAHAYTPNTILIHRLKSELWFVKAARHFMPKDLLSPLSGANEKTI
ncbi:hypothetical protein BASA60_010164 [Batrachochytrium salamandrivorans]|nr:hypothetical protein BASA60_010164 [Batrachochytrium salamandrivorans]